VSVSFGAYLMFLSKVFLTRTDFLKYCDQIIAQTTGKVTIEAKGNRIRLFSGILSELLGGKAQG
jgi:hypothetical protein